MWRRYHVPWFTCHNLHSFTSSSHYTIRIVCVHTRRLTEPEGRYGGKAAASFVCTRLSISICMAPSLPKHIHTFHIWHHIIIIIIMVILNRASGRSRVAICVALCHLKVPAKHWLMTLKLCWLKLILTKDEIGWYPPSSSIIIIITIIRVISTMVMLCWR